MTRLTTFADAEAVAARAAVEIASQLQRARAERGVAQLALSGGSTPQRTYELLASELSDWDSIEVWFVDERCVAPDHEQSNYRAAAAALLSPAGIPAECVQRMEGELGPHAGARRYAEKLGALVPVGDRGLPELDVVVLGIGPDGHVASLFPGCTQLAEERALVLDVTDSPKPPPERITLSLGVLRAARCCLLLATGASKADAISAALAEPTPHVPASLLRRERLTVMVDDAAAPTPIGD
ncbi:MAG TPA: 6-phosphogluconolactonase [Solirubrobacteraceae bacterium]|nr:6-phosphogluconolactonase [Solirubrobacteraceae bacterium]